jgi:hypothetical protein
VRVGELAPVAAQVVVELVAWNEAGADPAGNRLQLPIADQGANLVLGAAELGGNLADGQWRGPVHVRSLRRAAILQLMATRADFSDAEWKAMQEGIAGAGMFVALVDRGFMDSFKEANALAHHLRQAHEHSDSVLIRDLAAGHDRPFGMTSSPEEIEGGTVTALQQAVAALQAKSPEDLPAYRQLVLEVAQSVAEAAKGVSPQENQALDRIRAALS